MAGTGGLLVAALMRENLQTAFKRVKANKGAAGVDGLDIGQTAELLGNFKARIRQLTRRSGGRSMAQIAEKLRRYVLGWKGHFGLAQTPGVWRELDEWLRHRLRAIQPKHWERLRTIYRELKALGTSEDVAKQVAVNNRRWWRNSNRLLKTVLTIAYFDSLGVPRLS